MLLVVICPLLPFMAGALVGNQVDVHRYMNIIYISVERDVSN